MENITSKIYYLKGLAEGLKIEEKSDEGKVIAQILEVLEDLADTFDDCLDAYDELEAKVDEIDEANNTVSLTVSVFGRQTSATIEISAVQKLDI